ncbi:MAG: hypothetical protein HQ536_03295 [Parcubacteria group bacterium]|nr:hypothetical protein [Parcubacteria group bacterium]
MRVLFVEFDGATVVDYDPELHKGRVRKFLAWEDLMIVGPQRQHRDLYDDYSRDFESSSTTTLTAAGDCSGGFITWWWSGHYKFHTPEEMKPEIRLALSLSEHPVRDYEY